MKPKDQNCIIKGPFIKAINENGEYFTTDKNAICSQCKKPFKKHKEWK